MTLRAQDRRGGRILGNGRYLGDEVFLLLPDISVALDGWGHFILPLRQGRWW